MAMTLVGRARRKNRIRKKVSGTADRPRMTVFRSLKHLSAQIIDDDKGVTLAAASTVEPSFKEKSQGSNCKNAKLLGELIAERAKSKGIEQVVFDRNGCRYHGRIKALADSAREKGLKF